MFRLIRIDQYLKVKGCQTTNEQLVVKINSDSWKTKQKKNIETTICKKNTIGSARRRNNCSFGKSINTRNQLIKSFESFKFRSRHSVISVIEGAGGIFIHRLIWSTIFTHRIGRIPTPWSVMLGLGVHKFWTGITSPVRFDSSLRIVRVIRWWLDNVSRNRISSIPLNFFFCL